MYKHLTSLVFAGLALSLTACSPAEPISESTPTREPLVVESATPSATSTPSPTPSESRSDRGNLIFSVGDEIDLSADGIPWATFKIDKITDKVKCTEEWADPRTKGRTLIGMTVSVRTEADSSGLRDDFYLSGLSWRFVDTNNVVFNGDLATDVTYSCLDESKILPALIGPGTKSKGLILLEVPSREGTLLSDDYGVEIDLQSALKG